jgi:ribosomal protein S17
VEDLTNGRKGQIEQVPGRAYSEGAILAGDTVLAQEGRTLSRRVRWSH